MNQSQGDFQQMLAEYIFSVIFILLDYFLLLKKSTTQKIVLRISRANHISKKNYPCSQKKIGATRNLSEKLQAHFNLFESSGSLLE